MGLLRFYFIRLYFKACNVSGILDGQYSVHPPQNRTLFVVMKAPTYCAGHLHVFVVGFRLGRGFTVNICWKLAACEHLGIRLFRVLGLWLVQ